MAASGSAHEHWSSRLSFLLAAVGFAVGLGNIWRFPYVTGENGGAAFVLVYVVCAFGISVPILMAELLIGRRGGLSPPASIRAVAEQEGRSKRWQLVGHMNLLAAFTIEVVYSAIVGWVLWYLYKAVVGGFAGVDTAAAETQFNAVLGDTAGMVFWTAVGLTLTGVIVYSGVKDGIERAVTWLMPLLFLLLAVLVVYNGFAGGFALAVEWLFTPDFGKITPQVLLAAVGQAFFSIGVGMAAMMTYGAYLPKRVSITRSVVVIISADTLVALLAGLVVFPVVFRHGLDPAAGPGLIFQTLPVAFSRMPGGHLFSILFFLLLAVAGITSMVGLVESLTAWVEEHRGFARRKSSLLVTLAIGTLGILSIVSYNVLSEWRVLGRDFNGAMDYFSNQILLPLGGLLIAVFGGWLVSRQASRDELALADPRLHAIWYFLIRYVVPPAVLIIFVMRVAT
jgi:NSS family neurotransmitter:Na+ symporter